MQLNKELIIIGGGAAGLTAAQYGARTNLSVLLLEEMAAGGQCLLIDNLENYPGFPDPISGIDLSNKLEDQALKFGAEIRNGSAVSVNKKDSLFVVEADDGTFISQAVIIATGAKHRMLDIPGEQEFGGRGVSYCATCDGPFFRDKRILVVGGGDAACDEASFLANLTDKVILIHRRDRFRAQKSLAERVLKNPHIEVFFNTELNEIKGDMKVERATLFNNKDKESHEEKIDAVFVFIGSQPRTQFVKGISLDESGYIITDQRMESNIKGLFAAGDVRSSPFRQLVVAAGEGATAAHSAAQYIDDQKGEAYI